MQKPAKAKCFVVLASSGLRNKKDINVEYENVIASIEPYIRANMSKIFPEYLFKHGTPELVFDSNKCSRLHGLYGNQKAECLSRS